MSSWLGSSTSLSAAAMRGERVVSSLWCAQGRSLGQIENVRHGSKGESCGDSEVWT